LFGIRGPDLFPEVVLLILLSEISMAASVKISSPLIDGTVLKERLYMLATEARLLLLYDTISIAYRSPLIARGLLSSRIG